MLRRHDFARLRMLRAMSEQLDHQEAMMEERVRIVGLSGIRTQPSGRWPDITKVVLEGSSIAVIGTFFDKLC